MEGHLAHCGSQFRALLGFIIPMLYQMCESVYYQMSCWRILERMEEDNKLIVACLLKLMMA